MAGARKIVVEAWIPAPVELVWERSQDADQHASWDLRFTTIGYLPEKDARGYHLMDYRTRIALGVEIVGVGRYLHSTPLRHSTFEFDSEDWKSIIRDGRGIWQYEPRPRRDVLQDRLRLRPSPRRPGPRPRPPPLPAPAPARDRMELRDPAPVVRRRHLGPRAPPQPPPLRPLFLATSLRRKARKRRGAKLARHRARTERARRYDACGVRKRSEFNAKAQRRKGARVRAEDE